jgi:hypothetical protein
VNRIFLDVLLKLNPGGGQAGLEDVEDDFQQRSDTECPAITTQN